ncbi:MAG: hypothetical protein CYPHOPRED_003959 [Cyphobasidiales sp. Tagirdzhanova-0007]|nr:MAG: hypothetical protein CYPHOPRED_003959 [Cyphobasidiales sp. Tagirdzhanova-0007]
MVKIMVLGHRGVYISDDLAANSQDGIPPLSIAISIIEKSNAEQGSVMDFAGLEQQEADAINHLLKANPDIIATWASHEERQDLCSTLTLRALDDLAGQGLYALKRGFGRLNILEAAGDAIDSFEHFLTLARMRARSMDDILPYLITDPQHSLSRD